MATSKRVYKLAFRRPSGSASRTVWPGFSRFGPNPIQRNMGVVMGVD